MCSTAIPLWRAASPTLAINHLDYGLWIVVTVFGGTDGLNQPSSRFKTNYGHFCRGCQRTWALTPTGITPTGVLQHLKILSGPSFTTGLWCMPVIAVGQHLSVGPSSCQLKPWIRARFVAIGRLREMLLCSTRNICAQSTPALSFSHVKWIIDVGGMAMP